MPLNMPGQPKYMPSKTTKIRLFAVLAVSFLLTYYLWGPRFRAQCWIIDDHKIMQALGSDGVLSIGEIPGLLKASEIGQWGSNLRCRPTYWVLYYIECCLWGNSPFLWHLCRFLMYFASSAIFLYILQHNISFFYAVILLLPAAAAEYWIDIFIRLGPAENYATIGAALYFLGFYNYVRFLKKQIPAKTPDKVNVLLMTVGAIVAMGSKENFTMLVLVSIFLAVYARLKKKLNVFLCVNTAIISLFGLYVMLAIILAMSISGVDIYANEVTIHSRSNILLHAIPKLASDLRFYYICPAILLFASIVWRLENKKRNDIVPIVRKFCIAVVLASIVYLSQAVFYNGAWPNGLRYDFPGVFANYVFFVFTAICFVDLAKLVVLSKTRLHIVICVSVVLFFTFVSPLSQIVGRLQKIRAGCIDYVDRTTRFMKNINDIAAESERHPGLAILLDSFHPMDCEPIASVARFLRAHKVGNPICLRINGYSESNQTNPLDKFLAAFLEKVSRDGSEDDSFRIRGFKPLSFLNLESDEYIVVNFSGSNRTTNKQFRIWN